MARRPVPVQVIPYPEREELWFLVQLRGGWTACYRVKGRNGRPIVAELRVLASPVSVDRNGEPVANHETPGDGLTAQLLKDEVIVGRHVYELLPARLRELRQSPIGRLLFPAFFGALGFDAEVKPRLGRRGPKPWPDAEYARLARDYVAACEGGSRSPAADVARAWRMNPGALRAALRRARERGVLTRQTTGRAGGELTDYGKSLLRTKRTGKGKGR